jgi:hypothetical protein
MLERVWWQQDKKPSTGSSPDNSIHDTYSSTGGHGTSGQAPESEHSSFRSEERFCVYLRGNFRSQDPDLLISIA